MSGGMITELVAAGKEAGFEIDATHAAFAVGFAQGKLAGADPDAKPVLTYWGGIKARAHYANFVLAFFGVRDQVTFNAADIPYPGTPEWEAYSPKSYMGQLPQLTDGAVKMGQSSAIIRYLCRRLKICADASLADYATSQQMMDESQDLHSVLGKAHYAPDGDRTGAMDKLFAEGGAVLKHLAAMEACVTGSGWFGSAPQPGDLCVCASLDMLEGLEPGCLDPYPKLKAMLAAAKANAAVADLDKQYPYAYFKRKSEEAK